MRTILTLLTATTLIGCANDTVTTTVKSPDGTVTTTVNARKGINPAALDSAAHIANDAAAIYLASKIPSGK